MPAIAFFLLSLFFLTACAQAEQETAPVLTEKAQSMLRESGRTEFNAEAMTLLNQAITVDADYLPARQERLNLLLIDSDVKAALEDAREIVRIQKGIPEARIFYCILHEYHHGKNSENTGCFQEVADAITVKNQVPHTDLNYVLALRLSDSPLFEEAARWHIDQLEHEEVQDFITDMLFELSREELIGSYLPKQ